MRPPRAGKEGIEREMESLFNALLPQNAISRGDQARMRERVFQPNSFYVTEIRPLAGIRIVNLNSPSASSPELIQSSILVQLPPLCRHSRCCRLRLLASSCGVDRPRC